jgi:hypothetical protein
VPHGGRAGGARLRGGDARELSAQRASEVEGSVLDGHRTLLLTCAAALASVLILFALGASGWPGQGNGCRETQRPACFCETPREGLVAQPANTLSNLGFITVGLVIAAWADAQRRRGFRDGPANPITRGSFHPALFAVVTALLGPGSMALHATLTRWGGHVDVASMYLFAALLVTHGLGRIAPLPPPRFLAAWALLSSGLVATKLWVPISSDFVFGAVLAAAAAIDLAVRRRRPDLRRDGRLLALGGAFFAVAFAIWLPSRSGGALCVPGSWLQGHAAWHVLCALAAGSLFLYLRSERSVPAI